MRRRHSGTAPATVATLPPQGPSRSVPFSMPESVPFSMQCAVAGVPEARCGCRLVAARIAKYLHTVMGRRTETKRTRKRNRCVGGYSPSWRRAARTLRVASLATERYAFFLCHSIRSRPPRVLGKVRSPRAARASVLRRCILSYDSPRRSAARPTPSTSNSRRLRTAREPCLTSVTVKPATIDRLLSCGDRVLLDTSRHQLATAGIVVIWDRVDRCE